MLKFHPKPAFFLLTFSFVKIASGQGYVIISGKIIDKTTRQPIPYAHIVLMAKGLGTIANEQGEFYYRFPKIAADEDVTVARLGYKNLARKGAEFVSGDKNVLLELETAQPIVVDSAYVRGFDARSWVTAALGKVTKNYTDSPIVRIAYDFTPEGMDEVFKGSMKSAMSKMLGKNRREARRVSSFTNYLPYDGKWYLQDSQLLIQTDFPNKSDTLTGTIKLHFVTNDILKSNGKAVPPSEFPLDTAQFPSQKIPKYDEVYWSNFNHIIPSAGMRKILLSLVK